jgi:hypothetical protein
MQIFSFCTGLLHLTLCLPSSSILRQWWNFLLQSSVFWCVYNTFLYLFICWQKTDETDCLSQQLWKLLQWPWERIHLFDTVTLYSLVIYQVLTLQHGIGSLFFSFWRNSVLFFIITVLIYITSNNVQGLISQLCCEIKKYWFSYCSRIYLSFFVTHAFY